MGAMSWGSPWPPPPSGSQLSAPLLTSSSGANGLRSVSDVCVRVCVRFLWLLPFSFVLKDPVEQE